MIGVVTIPTKFRFPERFGDGSPGTCRACGCTEDHVCVAGCAWEDDNRTLCTRCAEGVLGIVNPPKRDRGVVQRAIRGASANVLALALELAEGDWRRALIRRAMR